MTFHGVSISSLVASCFSIVGISRALHGKWITPVRLGPDKPADCGARFRRGRFMKNVNTQPLSFKPLHGLAHWEASQIADSCSWTRLSFALENGRHQFPL